MHGQVSVIITGLAEGWDVVYYVMHYCSVAIASACVGCRASRVLTRDQKLLLQFLIHAFVSGLFTLLQEIYDLISVHQHRVFVCMA